MTPIDTVRDPVPPEAVAALRGAFPPEAHTRTAFPIMASASRDAFFWLQVLMGAGAWHYFIGAPVKEFLGQLARNAADDVWKNKGKIRDVLRQAAFSTLADISFAIAAANEQIGSAGVRVGLPAPDYQWASLTSLNFASQEEVSIALAWFVDSAQAIQDLVDEKKAAYPIHSPVSVETEPAGTVVVWWITSHAVGVARFTKAPGGTFVEQP